MGSSSMEGSQYNFLSCPLAIKAIVVKIIILKYGLALIPNKVSFSVNAFDFCCRLDTGSQW